MANLPGWMVVEDSRIDHERHQIIMTVRIRKLHPSFIWMFLRAAWKTLTTATVTETENSPAMTTEEAFELMEQRVLWLELRYNPQAPDAVGYKAVVWDYDGKQATAIGHTPREAVRLAVKNHDDK